MQLFGQCVVVETTMHWPDIIEYLALCEKFEELEDDVAAPFYDVAWWKDVDGGHLLHSITKSKFQP